MVRLHWSFEFDEDKAAANLRKHRISFDVAAEVLRDQDGDRFHYDERDLANAVGEDRYLTIGSHPEQRKLILVISWTDRSTEDEKITRIISARRATKGEVKRYAEGLGS